MKMKQVLVLCVLLVTFQINISAAGSLGASNPVASAGAEVASTNAEGRPSSGTATATGSQPAGSSSDFANFLANLYKFSSVINNQQAAGCNGQNIICSILVTDNSTGQNELKAVDFTTPINVTQCQQNCIQSIVTCVAYEITNITTSVRQVFPVSGTSWTNTPCNCAAAPVTKNNQPANDMLPSTVATTPSTPSTTPTTVPTTTTTPATTTIPTTTQPLPASAYQVAFTASSSSSVTQPGSTIPLTPGDTNLNGHFSNNQFAVSADGIYLAHACVGIAGTKTANVRIQGSAPLQLGMTWDATVQNGVETNCRSGLIQATRGSSVSLVLDSGVAYSDANLLTSLTMFSVSNVMSAASKQRIVYAVSKDHAPTVNNTLTPIPMTTVIAPSDSTTFVESQALYKCTMNAPHLIVTNIGVATGMPTLIQITSSANNPNSISPGLTRTTLLYNGMTSQSRNVILPCTTGGSIQMNLLSGTVNTSDTQNLYNLTTFAVIPIDQVNVSSQVVWSIFKWYIAYNNQPGQGTNQELLTNVTVNQGSNPPPYDLNSRVMTAPVSGTYYTCISSGAGVGLSGSTFTLTLNKGSQILTTIVHGSTAQGATDLFEKCIVVHLNQGDQIGPVGQMGGYFYSSITQYEVSFNGMLLYAD